MRHGSVVFGSVCVPHGALLPSPLLVSSLQSPPRVTWHAQQHSTRVQIFFSFCFLPMQRRRHGTEEGRAAGWLACVRACARTGSKVLALSTSSITQAEWEWSESGW